MSKKGRERPRPEHYMPRPRPGKGISDARENPRKRGHDAPGRSSYYELLHLGAREAGGGAQPREDGTMKARFCAVLAVLAAFTGGVRAGERHEETEPRREAVHGKADLLAGRAAEEPRWKREMRTKLQRKVSFEFVETPLSEAINFLQTLTKINMILDPKALEGRGGANTPITLKVRDMTLELALKWILRLAELDYTLKGKAVFISTPERMRGNVEFRIYDVRDLTAAVTDFPGPEVSPTGRLDGPLSKIDMTGAPFKAKNTLLDQIDVAAGLAEMLQVRVKPDTWAAELGTSIEERGGKLIVLQTPDIHALIAKLLDTFRASTRLQVRVDTRFVAVSEDLLAKLRTRDRPGAGVIFLKAPQVKMIEKALAAGDEAAKLVETAGLACYNTQRAHVMSGRSFERRGEGGKLEGTYFRGTVLDVRPTVSFDRRYVTMELRLTRAAPSAKHLEAPPQFFRARTTTTCLETDTVLITGATVPGTEGKTRLVALVTPTILRLEPGAARPKPKAAAPPRPEPPARARPPARPARPGPPGGAGAGMGAPQHGEKEVF